MYCDSRDTVVAQLTQAYPLSSLGNSIYTTNIPALVFVYIVKQRIAVIFLVITLMNVAVFLVLVIWHQVILL